MTFTPALAAKIAERNATTMQEQIDSLTTLDPKIHRTLVAAGRADRAVAYEDLQGAAKRIVDHSGELVDRIIDRTRPDSALAQFDRDLATVNAFGGRFATEVQFAAQDAHALRLWEKFKVVYAIDSHLLEELGDTDDDTMVPADLWARLPHPDPFVALPESLALPIPEENLVQWVDGFWITGSHKVGEGKYVGVSTHAPSAGSQISLLIAARVMQPDGRRQAKGTDGRGDMNWTRLTLESGQTVGSMVAQTQARFVSTSAGVEWQRDVPILIRKLISVLIYLCASNADMVAVPTGPPRRAKGKGGARPTRGPKVIATGFTVGAAIRAYRATAAGGERGPATGRHVAPHIRRAHFHTYRVGPGRTGSEVKWLLPFGINMGDGKQAKTTVHEVKESKRHG